MPVLFNDSPETIFASAAGLIVYFKIMPAIPVASTKPDKDEKYVVYFELAFPRRGVKKPE